MDILIDAVEVWSADDRVDGAHDQSRRRCGGHEFTSSQSLYSGQDMGAVICRQAEYTVEQKLAAYLMHFHDGIIYRALALHTQI